MLCLLRQRREVRISPTLDHATATKMERELNREIRDVQYALAILRARFTQSSGISASNQNEIDRICQEIAE